jgi:hypothetical protein
MAKIALFIINYYFMKSFFEKVLSFLYNVTIKVLPILLLLSFMVGVVFNLVNVQMLSIGLSLGICIPFTIVAVYFYGKYLKLW